ncbi:MAG: glycosyltransferase family 4 protein [Pirellulaceae bacterium]|nr:glycosyltransferase family 4 protein [Pirellulaceae bacterium]
MHILHVIDHLGYGGAQTVLLDLVRCWPSGEDRLHVVGLGRQDALAEQFAACPGVRVQRWGSANWDPQPVARLRSLLRQGPFDVIHAHLNRSIGTLLLSQRPAELPAVVHIHADPAHDRLLRLLLRRAATRADAMLAVSEHTANSVRRIVPRAAGRLVRVSNAVDPRRIDGCRAVFADESVQHVFAPGAFVLGLIGRLDRAKGIGYLLQALARLDRSIVATIVGDGRWRRALQQQCQQLGLRDRVQFTGFQSNVVRWLHAFDALVLPSLSEGLPITVLEAFAAGTPVIASRVGGIEEAVQDGVSGLLVPPRNVPALCQAITRLRNSDRSRERMIDNARRRLLERFSAPRMASEIWQLYSNLRQ